VVVKELFNLLLTFHSTSLLYFGLTSIMITKIIKLLS
jgi:hypothetical protein